MYSFAIFIPHISPSKAESRGELQKLTIADRLKQIRLSTAVALFVQQVLLHAFIQLCCIRAFLICSYELLSQSTHRRLALLPLIIPKKRVNIR